MPLREEMIRQGNFLFKYRSFLPVLILLVGISLYANYVLSHSLNSNQIWELFSFAVCLLGLTIRMYCIGHAHDNTSGRNTKKGQIADDINQTGMYSTCRHPLYLGNFFMWLGLAMFTYNLWFIIAFIFLFWVYYERIMFAEEEYLRLKFGLAYTSWANVTPAFIPDWSKWTKPDLRFSWTKVIRQEKAGILNMFLVIWLFKAVATYFVNGNIDIENRNWTWGLILALIWYILIKLLQKTTPLFSKDR